MCVDETAHIQTRSMTTMMDTSSSSRSGQHTVATGGRSEECVSGPVRVDPQQLLGFFLLLLLLTSTLEAFKQGGISTRKMFVENPPATMGVWVG